MTRLLGKFQAPLVPENIAQKEAQAAARKRAEALAQLKDEFLRLAADSDRNKAGLALELLLNKLFNLFELSPREPFRVVLRNHGPYLTGR